MMNILIDLRWMTIGRAGGMEQMAFELLASIAALNRVDRFWLYCPIVTFEEWGFERGSRVELIDSDRFELVPEIGYSDSFYSSGPSTCLGVVQRDGMSRENNRIVNVDLIHSVGGYIAKELRGYRGVLTIHDLQHLHFPENFEESELRARKENYQASIDAASVVICDSESVRKDILASFDVDANKVVTLWIIPSGFSLRRLPNNFVKSMLNGLGLDSGYLFFPSHGWPHKNHEKLILAFARVKESIPNLTLVLTGGELGADHPASRRIRELGMEQSVKHLGFRTPLEIRCLFQGAAALVYPSLFEGFGMPVAEAILAGTPVACSNIAPLREIGGDAIVTFDPRSPDAIASVILKVIGDSEVRASLLENGAEQRKVFSSLAIARDTCNLYRSLVGLDPIESHSLTSKRGLKWEKAQHWVRIYRDRMNEGDWFGISTAWWGAFWNSPSMALRARKKRLKRIQGSESCSTSSFKGRYGDGWIGPEFQDWLMIPSGAKRLDLRFQAPPEPLGSDLIIQFSIDGNQVCTGRFEGNPELHLAATLSEPSSDLVEIRIECSGFFIPKEEGFSEDSRELSVKLVETSWS